MIACFIDDEKRLVDEAVRHFELADGWVRVALIGGAEMPVHKVLGFKIDGVGYRWLGDRLVREAEFPA